MFHQYTAATHKGDFCTWREVTINQTLASTFRLGAVPGARERESLQLKKADSDRAGKPTFPYPRLHGACERCGIGWLTLCNASSAVARPFAGFPVG